MAQDIDLSTLTTDSNQVPVTKNIYEQVLAASEDQRHRELNGIDYRHAFPLVFTDSQAAYMQFAKQFESHARNWPNLAFRLKNQFMPAIPAVTDVRIQVTQANMDLNTRFIEKLENEIPADPMEGIPLVTRPAWVRQGAFLNSNLSQYHRRKQELNMAQLWPKLQRIAVKLAEECYGSAAVFSLRPLLAMSASRHEDIRRLTNGRIGSLHTYYSQALSMVETELSHRGIHHYLFSYAMQDLKSSNDATEYAVLPNFWRWTRMFASAQILRESRLGLDHWDMICLMPAGIHPVLFYEPLTECAVFLRKVPIPLLQDQLVFIKMVPIRTPADPDGNQFQERVVEIVSANQNLGVDWILRAHKLAIVASLTTLFASTLNMGKGNHKPAWIESPMNNELIAILPRWIRYVELMESRL